MVPRRDYWEGSTDEKLNAILERLGALEAKVDSLLRWRSYVMGGAAIVSALLAAAWAWFKQRWA